MATLEQIVTILIMVVMVIWGFVTSYRIFKHPDRFLEYGNWLMKRSDEETQVWWTRFFGILGMIAIPAILVLAALGVLRK